MSSSNMTLFLLLNFLLGIVAGAQQSMVMTSWFGTGTRNVKHETVANNILDENGSFVFLKSQN